MKSRLRRQSLSFFLAAALIAAPGMADAQQASGQAEPETVEPSEEQLSINQDGVAELVEGNYARAVALFEQSLLIGELNVTYLNLGRAYQKLGNCAKAKAALAEVDDAPRVAKPAPAVVEEKAAEYRADLQESCAPASKMADSQSLWGWTSAAAGLAVLGTGVGLHFAAEAKRDDVRHPQTNDGLVTSVTQKQARDLEDEANTLDNVGAAMVVTGAIGIGVGSYLLFFDGESSAPTWSMGLRDGGALFTLTDHF